MEPVVQAARAGGFGWKLIDVSAIASVAVTIGAAGTGRGFDWRHRWDRRSHQFLAPMFPLPAA